MACNHTHADSYWEYDNRGIPLCRVCNCCRKERLSKYSARVLDDEQQILVFGQVVDDGCTYCPGEQVEEDY